MNTGLPPVLLDLISSLLDEHMEETAAGHCVRVDDLASPDASAIAARMDGRQTEIDVRVLTVNRPGHPLEIEVDHAVELRNRKQRPLLLLIPEGTGHAASSLDNSFEPLPLIDLLRMASDRLEADLAAAPGATIVTELKRVLGRARQIEPWARFLGDVKNDPTANTIGEHLWQVGLVPDLGGESLESRLRRNHKAVAAIARPLRTTARVADRLINAELKDEPVRESLLAFFERDVDSLSDNTKWARELGQRYPGRLTFEQWPMVELQQAALSALTVVSFRRDNDLADPQCKLRLGDDGQLYCDVAPDHPGTVVVKWSTQPSKVTSVASWRVEVLPPEDFRLPDTIPIATTKVKGEKRTARLRVDVTEDDLAAGTLFVARVQALDADGNELTLHDESLACADSDQFVVQLREHVPERGARKTGAASLAEAVLRVAVESGGDLSEDAPSWDVAGKAFGVRIGGRRIVFVRVSHVIVDLQRQMTDSLADALAFESISPVGEPIDPADAVRISLSLPPALSERRRRLFSAMAERHPRDAVETLAWDDELRGQVRAYLQAYRRALDSASDDRTRADLLAMDTLSIRVGTAAGEVHGIVLLPTHPLRLAWVAAHDELLRKWAGEVAQLGASKTQRAESVDLSLASCLSAANTPFTVIDREGNAFAYSEELTHGAALYLPPGDAEPQASSEAVCAAIDVVRDSAGMSAVSGALSDRLCSYRTSHPGIGVLRLMAVNPGSGALLRRALDEIVLPQNLGESNDDRLGVPPRLEVFAYSDHLSYTDPVADLRRLQREVASSEAERSANHLVPPMGLAVRSLRHIVQDREGHHLAVIQDLLQGEITALPPETVSGSASFQDLLTPLAVDRLKDDASAGWCVSPALKPRGPARLTSDIVDAHRAHQNAVAAHLELGAPTPALSIRLDPQDLERIRTIHRRADWVITVARGISIELYEDARLTGPDGNACLLDYAPDFLEGLGDRVTVTTAHHDEVLRILGENLERLRISSSDAAAQILERLSLVSGRLALRLLGDTSRASEAVSLAALIAHLEHREQLDGLIVIPVDAHPEIFAPPARGGDEPARRCDLLFVRVTQRSLRIECVEVKARREGTLPMTLADRIVDQLETTSEFLRSRFFATDPPRVDSALQRSRLAGLLHYYAQRSARYGLIEATRLEDVHRNIDRLLEDQPVSPEITMRGYVISLMGTAGFPARHRNVPITVLTGGDLGQAGFTVPGIHDSPGSLEREFTPPQSDELEQVPSSAQAPQRQEESTGTDEDLGAEILAERAPSPLEAAELSKVAVTLGNSEAGTPVSWEVSTNGSPHAFILGIPGQGKSVTTRHIIREFGAQGLPSIVLDFHGDMADDPPDGAQVVDAAAGLPFSPFELAKRDIRAVNENAWEVAEIITYVCGLGEIQRNNVYNGLRQAYLLKGDDISLPTMAQFADAVEEVEQGARGRNARDRIRPLTDFGLFADEPEESFAITWRSGLVVNLSTLNLETVQLAAGAFLLRKIYREMFRWEQARHLRLAIVLDEAHRLARDVTLPKIMKEGRKYGVSVVVSSQGAADFHRDVLGNAGTKIVFRTNYPASKVVAGFLRGRDGQDLSQQIEQLSVGCAYVATPDHSQARRVYMTA
ncbi:ATP-binding protein [Nonomuraea typhae]|uniref:ATP-binding protein n=1 Tax=Nonomuraea typhae TaxID=2603600 RepID=A0ABW7YWJ3_9ACTN